MPLLHQTRRDPCRRAPRGHRRAGGVLPLATRRAGASQVTTLAVRHGPAMLMVWSDGPPLEPSVRRHLFEPFFSSESRSSGLGLFICRELCERHGATIHYQRLLRPTEHGDVEGNAFSVYFRKAGRLPESASLFDTLVV